MINTAILFAILSSIFFGISNILRNYTQKFIGPLNSNIITNLWVSFFWFITFLIIYFNKINYGPIHISNINKSGIIFSLFDGISILLGIFLSSLAFYYNYKSKKPLNLGILTSVIAFNFIVTFIINFGINIYSNKNNSIKYQQLIGLLLIIAGIIIIGIYT
jgi:uncharacterized membrane protein